MKAALQGVPLSELATPSGVKAGKNSNLPVYSVTKHSGFVPSLEYFNKQVFSRDLSGYKLVEPGELAYATIHLDEGSIGRCPERCLISPMYTTFRVNEQKVDATYLCRFLKSPKALAQYPQLGKGSVERRRAISFDRLSRLEIPLPPLAEQRRIAEVLDKAEALRVKRRAALAKLDSLTQSLFLDLFGDPATNPKGFEIRRIRELLESASYGTSEKSGPHGEYAVLRMNNITRSGEMDFTDLKFMDLEESLHERYLVRTGDVLFNRTNSAELVGKTGIIRASKPMAYAGYLIRLRVNAGNEPEFLWGFLNSEYSKRMLRGMCKSIIGMANINATEIQAMKIPHPPLDLQREFARRVAAVEKLKTAQRAALAELDALFASLQHRAFRGEL